MAACVARLEETAAEDPGGRGIAPLVEPGELEAAAKAATRARSVALLTGYPCCIAEPPTETDGPPGTLALARTFRALGKRVVILTDECNHGPIAAALEASNEAYPAGETPAAHDIQLRAFPPGDVDADGIIAEFDLDHIVAVERPGRSAAGTYCTMRGRAMDGIARLEQLLVTTDGARRPGLTSTGVGDGGNELGMGKRIEAVRAHIPLGEKIGSVVPTDHLVVAGVSNWGAYALALALAAAAPRGAAAAAPAGAPALLTLAGEKAVLDGLVRGGARDGRAPAPPPSVAPRRNGCSPGRVHVSSSSTPAVLYSLPARAGARARAFAAVTCPRASRITGAAESTVDGLSWETHASKIGALLALTV